MLLIQTQNITVKLRYYYNNNGQHWFQRSVPKTLQRFYGGQKLVRHKLPSNNAQMLTEIERLTRHYDQPYFLHTLLNQCALGLRYYGCDEKDIFEFIAEVFRLHPPSR